MKVHYHSDFDDNPFIAFLQFIVLVLILVGVAYVISLLGESILALFDIELNRILDFVVGIITLKVLFTILRV